ENVGRRHFDIEVLGVHAGSGDLEQKLVIFFCELDRWFPYQLLLRLQPIINVSAKDPSVFGEDLVGAPHDAVLHPFDFIEDGFALSGRNYVTHCESPSYVSWFES